MVVSFVRRIIGTCLLVCLCSPAFALSNAGSPKKSASQHVKEIDNFMKKIHDSGAATGNPMYFYGHQNYVTYWTNKPINRTDLNFGTHLFKIYNMYCDLKGHAGLCLGNSLYVYFKITGSSYKSSSLYIQVNGGQAKTTNSYQELRSFFFDQLEKIGSKTPISTADRNKIQPAPKTYAKVKFLLHTKSNGKGNQLWTDGASFRSNVLKQARLSINSVLNFERPGDQIVKNDTLYNKSQKSLLDYYASRRDSSVLTAAISSPNANDSGGVAWINQPNTVFVMKSCSDMHKKDYSFDKDTKCTARGIFMHELGHVFGLRHCTTDPEKQSSLCTENFLNRSDGHSWFYNSVTSRTNSTSVRYEF